MTETEDILAQLIAFDTVSSKPNLDCIGFIEDYLARLGVGSSRIGDGAGKACLFASIGEGQGGVALAGHTDVVPVEGQAWVTDPFRMAEKDGKLYGRGSCDMKGFLACVLAAVPALAGAELKRPVHLIFTYDEETTMEGARRLTAWLDESGIRPDWIWLGEPTMMDAINAHKGVASYKTAITGKAAHSSQPHRGLSANLLGARLVEWTYEQAALRARTPVSGSDFDPPCTSFNVGRIDGGTASNIISDKCEVTWEFRLHPGDTTEGVMRDYEAFLDAEILPAMRNFPEAGIETVKLVNIPPFTREGANPGEDALLRLTGQNRAGTVAFGTEAGIFQALGSPVVICGPGSIDQAHQANEFVTRDQLALCDDFLAKILL